MCILKKVVIVMFKNKANSRNNISGSNIAKLRKSLPKPNSQQALANRMQLLGIDLDKKGVVPKFFRNMELILKHIKTKDKLYCFNKTNVLIIESKDFKIKEEKKPESTKLNSINISVINEELLKKPSLERKRLIEEKGERLINYVYDLLENCPNDVRDYLQNHPFESN